MTQNILCDYSVARLSLGQLQLHDLEQIRPFCIDGDDINQQDFLFLVLPDAAMPDLNQHDCHVAINHTGNTISWHIIDEIDGKQLQFQIGSASQPLDTKVVYQLEHNGFIFAIFINARSGAPKGVRVFKKNSAKV